MTICQQAEKLIDALAVDSQGKSAVGTLTDWRIKFFGSQN